MSFDKNPSTGAARELQEDEYYSFGLRNPLLDNSNHNRYLYNGKEVQTDLTSQYDYGARFYDPVIARWTTPDPLAEAYNGWSLYNYGADNPIYYVDKDGKFLGTLIGAVAGAVIGGVDAAIHHKKVWKGIGHGAVSGAVAGAIVDLTIATAGTGTIAIAAAGGLSGAAGSAVGQYLDNGKVSLTQTAVAGGLGLFTGYLGAKIAPAISGLFAPEGTVSVGEITTLTVDWNTQSSAPLVGDIANSIDEALGNGTVKGVEVPFDGEYGAGDIDISLDNANIEVKSRKKLNLTQSIKNANQAKAQGKAYYLYNPNATSAQIKEAARQGITVIKDQNKLLDAINSN